MGKFSDALETQTPQGGKFYQALVEQGRLPSSDTFSATFQPTGETLYDEDLINDRDFVEASKVLYTMNESKYADPLADDRQYAEYGIEAMGWFNYSLPKMTLDASRISGATDEQQRAFLYMMESYDELGVSFSGTGRFFKGFLTDFTNLIGVTTLGFGLLGKEGAKAASKQGVKELLKASTKGGIIAGLDASIYTAVDDINRQVVETAVSGEDIDLGRTAKVATVGAAAGFGLGTVVTAAVKKIRGKTVKEVAETIDEETLIKDLPDLKVEDSVVLDTATPAGRMSNALDKLVKAVKRTVPEGRVAAVADDGVQSMDELVEAVQPLNQLMVEASAESPAELAEYLLKTEMTPGQEQFLANVATQTVTVLKAKAYNLNKIISKLEGEEAMAVRAEIDKIEEITAPIDMLDSALSTIAGQKLRARQEGINVGDVRGVTIKSLQKNGLTREEAEREFNEIMQARIKSFNNTRDIRELNTKIEAAKESGDYDEYLQLKKQKETKQKEFESDLVKAEPTGFIRAAYENFNKPINLLNEVMISFVFSPATVIINTVPSLAKAVYKPALNNLMQDGLSRTSRRKMVAEYSAMKSVTTTALRAAKMAWDYERSILTGDSARFLEDYNAIPRKYGGGVIRFFPRLLLSTDAFFETIHYRGYKAGEATGIAMEKGIERGYKGEKLDKYVAKQVEKALKKAYEPEENAIDILREVGISRGFKGKKLSNFIKQELDKNGSMFQKATDQDGRDYVQDVLFKRDFSGQGASSQLARGYERFVNKNPIMRAAGQLFFRTPVRVFEEGVRLTPGLNLISPNFIKDLSGANGTKRQIRAQGEALMSYAVAGSVFSLYSTGNITGSLGTDYKQRRQGENTGQLEPYMIRFSNGDTFNYRNFDPFATPIKILVNALERAEVLAYRAEQGERINETEFTKNFAAVSLATGAIAQSIRDANLASGVDAAMQIWDDLQDPESEDQHIKFLGQKVTPFIPNTLYKIQMLDNPVLADPKTLDQFIRYRINPQDPLVPKQYTAVGRARTLSNPMASLVYFDMVTDEERMRGVPEKELEVEKFLYKVAQAGDTHFTAPYKTKYLPDVDLRTRVTKDGQETYYDRWMRYTHESGVIDALYSLKDLPQGSATDVGVAEKYAKKTLTQFREQAMIRMLSEEIGVANPLFLERELMKAENKAGMNNVPNLPFLQ